MVKYVQLHGNQDKQQLNQILKNQRHIGKIHMLRIEMSHLYLNKYILILFFLKVIKKL